MLWFFVSVLLLFTSILSYSTCQGFSVCILFNWSALVLAFGSIMFISALRVFSLFFCPRSFFAFMNTIYIFIIHIDVILSHIKVK